MDQKEIVVDLLEGLKLFSRNFRLRLEIEDLARNWKELYKDLNVREQLILANNWCLGNREKAPKVNFIRFLNSWMKLANEWAQKVPKHEIYKENKPDEDEVMSGEDFRKMREAIRK